MLKRLRRAHPVGYCLLTEVVFLAVLMVVPVLLVLLLAMLGVDLTRVDDYFLSAIQELLGALVAVFFLKKTDRLGLLRRRGSGFFNGILVGMFPFAMICYTLYGKLLFGMPTDRPLRTGWQIAWYFIGMFTVGVAEEFLFRGVIAQTLLEHFGTSRAGIWKACLLSGLFFGGAHLTNILSSAPFGVLMQCVFAGSLGVLFAAIYFRTGNLWVLVFLHGAQDAASLLAGGLYGTENMSTAVSSYDSTMLLSVLVYYSVGARKLLCGKPVILIEKGRIVQENMKKTRITPDELTEFLRIEGIVDLASVKYAILETNGDISVLPYTKYKPASAKAAGVAVDDIQLPVTVISNGHILEENLPLLGKTRAWVDETLKSYHCTAKDVYLLSAEPGGKLYFSVKGDA